MQSLNVEVTGAKPALPTVTSAALLLRFQALCVFCQVPPDLFVARSVFFKSSEFDLFESQSGGK
jgi:hypothetical protein